MVRLSSGKQSRIHLFNSTILESRCTAPQHERRKFRWHPLPDATIRHTSTSRTHANKPEKNHQVNSTTSTSLLSADVPSELRLSTKALQQVELALEHGWAESTAKAYGHAVRRYILFCDKESIPNHLRYPAHEFVLCAFAASSAGVHAGSTARNNIAGLKAWHAIRNVPWNGGRRLHYILNGVENTAPPTSLRAPRPPVSLDMLSCLRNHLRLNDPRDACIFACACIAFWGQCRLGELIFKTRSDAKSKQSSVPSQRSIRAASRTSVKSIIIHLPHTKTHGRKGDDIILSSQHPPLDPTSALRSHLLINNLNPDTPLFSYASANTLIPLTVSTFINRCNEIWVSNGFPQTTGHSFRIGGTTELLLAGVHPDVVKTMGRWSSDAFLRYWRSLEDLVPRHIPNHRNPGAYRTRPNQST